MKCHNETHRFTQSVYTNKNNPNNIKTLHYSTKKSLRRKTLLFQCGGREAAVLVIWRCFDPTIETHDQPYFMLQVRCPSWAVPFCSCFCSYSPSHTVNCCWTFSVPDEGPLLVATVISLLQGSDHVGNRFLSTSDEEQLSLLSICILERSSLFSENKSLLCLNVFLRKKHQAWMQTYRFLLACPGSR